eukprot:CAMPEP_0115852656 /NCGR_PEP_ID=MMETSP0287-20121206/13108_1 /TAXON_ID=412157 /ORGANISM="Chrysochromulina rotalis, Strain UIO044" /LENGTH=167 /DNA_ID=CAMNT_0003306723 /DNA_START=63 /DNA_END=566 /DNA_ORIENTATION=-
MAASRRARAPCRRQAAAAAAAHSIETSTLHFGGPEVARGLERNRPARGNQASDSCSRAWSVSPGSAPCPSLSPRCQSHDCLNAICGAAAEGVAQVETGHGEPVGKTHSSERGPSLARQLGSGHAHAARQRWTAARVGLKRVPRAKGQNPEAQTVWGPFALEGLDPDP